MTNIYWAHGKFCANHPWEVIVSTAILVAFLMSVETSARPLRVLPFGHDDSTTTVDDTVVIGAIRFISVIYCCYQIGKLHKMDSKYVAFIACLFTVLSSFLFSTSVLNYLGSELSDFKDALLIFLLVIDLNKAILLAQVALSSSSNEDVKQNIANGISLLGPSLGFDTLVEILLISIGTLCGVRRLEVLCCFACLSAVVNYLVIMTFYPACLTILAELSKVGLHVREANSVLVESLRDQCQAPNPVVQRVKVVMSAALVIVHIQSRYDSPEDFHSAFNFNIAHAPDYFLSLKSFFFFKFLLVSFVFVCTMKILFRGDNELSSTVVKFLQAEKSVESVVTVEENVERIRVADEETQTFEQEDEEKGKEDEEEEEERSPSKCLQLLKERGKVDCLRDHEILGLVQQGSLSSSQLEKYLRDLERAVSLRRQLLGSHCASLAQGLSSVPFRGYEYSRVVGACCENVVGYIPLPVGIAGPLKLNGKVFHIPMATTEGCLVASTNRGCKALFKNGIESRLIEDGMSRGPVLRFESLAEASSLAAWLNQESNFLEIKEQFDGTSNFARLKKIKTRVVGRYLYLRFVASTGDAMGMNMLSKGTEVALKYIKERYFHHMDIVSLSGNFCSDKKPSAINWIEGRGKSVVCEAVVPAQAVREILKTSVPALVDLNYSKNLVGSAVAGSIGGFNAHAANIVTAMFLATGQDPAQNVVSSNCITLMEGWGEAGEDLYVSCSMPSLEVGTVGGGTALAAQGGCLELLGVRGSAATPGDHAARLAQLVCATVLAGELSLMAALASGHLVNSHLTFNRSRQTHTHSIL